MSTLKYVTTFIVTGAGKFPLDMLRHDMCHPMMSLDSNNIDRWEFGSTRQIALVTYHTDRKNNHVTSERWLSFGWTVTQIVTRKI